MYGPKILNKTDRYDTSPGTNKFDWWMANLTAKHAANSDQVWQIQTSARKCNAMPTTIRISKLRSENRSALRLGYDAVEMWWHTVTHGRGSEGETDEWSGHHFQHLLQAHSDFTEIPLPCVAVEFWEPSERLLIGTGKPRKTCVEVAGRRTFRILTSSRQSDMLSKNSNTHTVQKIHIR